MRELKYHHTFRSFPTKVHNVYYVVILSSLTTTKLQQIKKIIHICRIYINISSLLFTIYSLDHCYFIFHAYKTMCVMTSECIKFWRDDWYAMLCCAYHFRHHTVLLKQVEKEEKFRVVKMSMCNSWKPSNFWILFIIYLHVMSCDFKHKWDFLFHCCRVM